MRGRGLTLLAVALAVVGIGLLTYETVEAMRSIVIGTVGEVLLYLGVGLFVLAAVLVVVDLTTTDQSDEVIRMHRVDDSETQAPLW